MLHGVESRSTRSYLSDWYPTINTPFADAISAFHHLERGAFGKVVIRVQA